MSIFLVLQRQIAVLGLKNPVFDADNVIVESQNRLSSVVVLDWPGIQIIGNFIPDLLSMKEQNDVGGMATQSVTMRNSLT